MELILQSVPLNNFKIGGHNKMLLKGFSLCPEGRRIRNTTEIPARYPTDSLIDRLLIVEVLTSR